MSDDRCEYVIAIKCDCTGEVGEINALVFFSGEFSIPGETFCFTQVLLVHHHVVQVQRVATACACDNPLPTTSNRCESSSPVVLVIVHTNHTYHNAHE